MVEVNNSDGVVTSYQVKRNGSLKVISASVTSGQADACWIAGNNRGQVHTTNPGSSLISAYQRNFKGEVTFLDATAATGIVTLDEGISGSSKYLCALDPNAGGIDMYRINHDGSLASLGTVNVGLTAYTQGLAVK